MEFGGYPQFDCEVFAHYGLRGLRESFFQEQAAEKEENSGRDAFCCDGETSEMKILHVIPSLAEVRGGPTQVALNAVGALRQRGVDAEIATTDDHGSTLLDVPLKQRVEYKGVPVRFFSKSSLSFKEFIVSPSLTQWLRKHIRDYDLLDIHYLFSCVSTCAGAFARRKGVPYTLRAMGQLTPWALAQSKLRKLIYTSLFERRNLAHAAAIHCTSEAEAEDVRRFGIKTPTVILPLGVREPVRLSDAGQRLRSLYGIPAGSPVVLFLARFHPKKRPELLLQALSRLSARSYDFHLVLAGSGDTGYRNGLARLVSSVGLVSRTSFSGFVTDGDKDLLLQGSDIFVLPSFSENFGIVVAEAMAAGLPVIVTPGVQIAPDIAAAHAGLVVEGEVDALSDAIRKLLADPGLRRQLGSNGKQLAQHHYSWDVIARNLMHVYHTLVGK